MMTTVIVATSSIVSMVTFVAPFGASSSLTLNIPSQQREITDPILKRLDYALTILYSTMFYLYAAYLHQYKPCT